MVLALVVLLGPSWRQQPSPLNKDDAAIVVVLDVSSSMEQKDVQPSRLQRAKQKVSDLLALRPDKRAALVVYSGTAHTALSLTADQDILKQYLAAITPAVMPRSGKFPEYSLPLLDEILRESTAPASVLLFTDGLGADSRQAFATYFAARPHQLLVVGVGTEAQAPDLAHLDRRSLEALAHDAEGDYVALTVDDGDVRQLQRLIENHYVVVDDSVLPWLDSGYPLLFPAMALFLLWFRKGWTISWACLVLPVVLGSAPLPALAQDESLRLSAPSAAGRWFVDLWLTPDQQGRLLMQRGRYPQAAGRFTDPMWKGMAYYYGEEFMLAAEYFSRRDSDDALFNEANARAQGRDYVRAVDRFDRLLARQPDYPGAAQNRAQVAAIIDAINLLSASQMQEPGSSGEDKELGSDDAKPAQGADEINWQQAQIRQLSAQDILQDPATSAMWLRSVQQDPSHFLAIKFSMQLEERQTAAPDSMQDVP
jgi:Ca-activated chloride channel family protein